MIGKLFGILSGKKTYMTGFAMIAFNGFGWYTGSLTPDIAIKGIIEGIGLVFLRSGIYKAGIQ